MAFSASIAAIFPFVMVIAVYSLHVVVC
jgi:hypothetical protein